MGRAHAGNPEQLISEIRRAVADISPRTPASDFKPLADNIDRALAPTRFALVLIGVFGVVAVMLAAIAVYRVVSTTVRQRTAEIGIRRAFGASDASIFRLIVGQGLLVSVLGIGVGLVVALTLTGASARANLLASVRPTYAVMAVLFAGIAALACWLPARPRSRRCSQDDRSRCSCRPRFRAARLHPTAALRK